MEDVPMKKMPGWLVIVVAVGIVISPMLPAPWLLALASLGLVGLLVAQRQRGWR
jgi:hypothetical protein